MVHVLSMVSVITTSYHGCNISAVGLVLPSTILCVWYTVIKSYGFWGGLQRHNIHIRFHQNPLIDSQVVSCGWRAGPTDTIPICFFFLLLCVQKMQNKVWLWGHYIHRLKIAQAAYCRHRLCAWKVFHRTKRCLAVDIMTLHFYYDISYMHRDSEPECHLNSLYPDAIGPFNLNILYRLHFSMLRATLHHACGILLLLLLKHAVA